MRSLYVSKIGKLSFQNGSFWGSFRAADEQTWLEMLTKLDLQVSEPDATFRFWRTLVLAHGVGADRYYWIRVERGKVSEVNSPAVATIVEFVNRRAKEIGFEA